jgi:2-polyprenyl-6-methoxyphenol hydroxylase-like FAD-dependent oxidoreductase
MARPATPTTNDLDVLVVGGRTTGLMMAIRLRRQGLSVRIVDKSPGIDPHSRATLVHSRTLEILHTLGIAEDICARGQALRGMRLFVEGDFVLGVDHPPVDSPFPYGIALSQPKVEALLEEQLTALGATVERDTELLTLEQTPDLVRVVLRHSDGREEGVESAWLVGCDGAHSQTRHLLGLGFPGDQSRYPYLLADVVVQGADPASAYFYFLHREGDLFFMILDEGRRLIVANMLEDRPVEADPTLDEVQELVTRRSQADYPLSDPRWLAYFHIHYRLAERYRVGRVFLAGDAAHLNSLIGGHGMNTGIQDACNLAWKLTLASRGLASEALLDSYEAERRPVAEAMIAATRALTEPGENYPRMSPQECRVLIDSFKMKPEDLTAFLRNLEELDLDYGASPICLEGDETLPEDLRPGLEAKDVPGLRFGESSGALFDLLGGPSHCLLLFAQPVDEALRTAREIAERHSDWIEPHLVVDSWRSGDLPSGVSAIVDREAALVPRYGMEAGGLYLIRPDGYIAYRSRNLSGLESYLPALL